MKVIISDKKRKDKAEYSRLHYWIRKKRGKPMVCEYCGISSEEKNLCWANKSHNYIKDKKDFMALCHSCHKIYDDFRKSQKGSICHNF